MAGIYGGWLRSAAGDEINENHLKPYWDYTMNGGERNPNIFGSIFRVQTGVKAETKARDFLLSCLSVNDIRQYHESISEFKLQELPWSSRLKACHE